MSTFSKAVDDAENVRLYIVQGGGGQAHVKGETMFFVDVVNGCSLTKFNLTHFWQERIALATHLKRLA